jgi:SET domain-containing protein
MGMLKSCLVVKSIDGKGRGVFTNAKIPVGLIVEIAPVVVMSKADKIYLDKTLLHDYIFDWGKNNEQCCMALGYIPIYNHSYKSNCEYFMNFEEHTISIKTVKKIEKGEELTINYNGDWNDGKKVWFEVV